jgi:flagellar secretion chaperone FliS
MVLELELVDGAFERDDYKEINDRLCRVQDILLALRGTLRTDRWDGANNLSQLYFALYKELLEANMKKNRAAAQRVLGVVQELAAAWRRASEQVAAPAVGA